MSLAPAKMPVGCPQCGKQLMVPVAAAGKQGRCPSCSNVFVLPALVAAEEVEDELRLQPLAGDPFGQNMHVSNYQLQPTAPQAYAPQAFAPQTYAPPAGGYGQPTAQPAGFEVPNPYAPAAYPQTTSAAARKPIAAVCHGPQVLTAADVVRGRRVSAYPAVAPEVRLAGGEYVDVAMDAAVVDGNLVTAPAWPAHPAWLARFLGLLGTTISY